MTGSGKTTFSIRYLLNVPAACRFVFDDLGQYKSRLPQIHHASTAAQLEAALATRWVLFNPHVMFPGASADAFRYFCDWSLNAARRGPGKKVFVADEIWQYQSAHQIPRELAALAQVGRSENLELMSGTQLPHRLNSSITGQSTELVCFRLDEPLALDKIEELGIRPAEVSALPLGSFISVNRLSRGTLRGKLF